MTNNIKKEVLKVSDLFLMYSNLKNETSINQIYELLKQTRSTTIEISNCKKYINDNIIAFTNFFGSTVYNILEFSSIEFEEKPDSNIDIINDIASLQFKVHSSSNMPFLLIRYGRNIIDNSFAASSICEISIPLIFGHNNYFVNMIEHYIEKYYEYDGVQLDDSYMDIIEVISNYNKSIWFNVS